MKATYAVVIERTPNNHAAYAPEVPGGISTAKTWDEMLAMIHEAPTAHIEFLIEDNDPIPKSMMSIDDAVAFHCKELVKADEKVPVEHPGAPPTISTTFRIVEIEVPVRQPETVWTSLASPMARLGDSASAKPGNCVHRAGWRFPISSGPDHRHQPGLAARLPCWPPNGARR